MTRVKGSDLHVGDTIEVWWSPRRDTIIGLRPYDGPLAGIFPQGASIAQFASGAGMTIDHSDWFERINDRPENQCACGHICSPE